MPRSKLLRYTFIIYTYILYIMKSVDKQESILLFLFEVFCFAGYSLLVSLFECFFPCVFSFINCLFMAFAHFQSGLSFSYWLLEVFLQGNSYGTAEIL